MRGCKADLRTYQPAPAVATEEDAASDFPGARRLAPFNTLDKFTFDIKKQGVPKSWYSGTKFSPVSLPLPPAAVTEELEIPVLLRPALLRKQHPRN